MGIFLTRHYPPSRVSFFDPKEGGFFPFFQHLGRLFVFAAFRQSGKSCNFFYPLALHILTFSFFFFPPVVVLTPPYFFFLLFNLASTFSARAPSFPLSRFLAENARPIG